VPSRFNILPKRIVHVKRCSQFHHNVPVDCRIGNEADLIDGRYDVTRDPLGQGGCAGPAGGGSARTRGRTSRPGGPGDTNNSTPTVWSCSTVLQLPRNLPELRRIEATVNSRFSACGGYERILANEIRGTFNPCVPSSNPGVLTIPICPCSLISRNSSAYPASE
jgi:hypothetical protein